MFTLWRTALAASLAFSAGCLGFHRGPMPGEPTDATYAKVEGTRVRYIDVGEGPAVVLLHGFGSSIEAWAAVIPALANRHRVIALDLKGFGWTDRPPGDYSPNAQAQLVLGLLEQRGVDQFALVAHSWGSSVALEVTLQVPERVTRLALYDAYVFEEQVPMAFLWARAGAVGEAMFSLFYKQRQADRLAHAFYDPTLISEQLVDRVELALDRPGTAAAALAAVRGQRFAMAQRKYPTIRQPTLLLWGREDRVTPLSYGERLVRTLPNAELVVYPRCGHLPMIEAPVQSTRDVVAFLEAEPS